MQSRRRATLIILLSLGLLLFVVALKAFLPISTPSFRNAQGNIAPNSIAVVERWPINGLEQSVIIRGRDTSNPILIWLHGGPGSSETPVLRHFNAPLEERFTVVYWDQRHAGQSLDPFAPIPNGLTIDQYVDDLGVLVDGLRRRFHKDKVFLLGHSWGTVLGVLYAERHPENVGAYVGVGQVTNTPENEQSSYVFTLNEARKHSDAKAIATLEKLGPPPRSASSIFTPRDLLAKFGGSFHADLSTTKLVLIGATAREANWRDLTAFFAANKYSDQLTLGEFSRLVLDDEHIRFQVPIFILAGRYDHQSEASLAHRYFERLSAPRKEFIWFENSAHSPNFEEPENFNETIVRLLIDSN